MKKGILGRSRSVQCNLHERLGVCSYGNNLLEVQCIRSSTTSSTSSSTVTYYNTTGTWFSLFHEMGCHFSNLFNFVVISPTFFLYNWLIPLLHSISSAFSANLCKNILPRSDYIYSFLQPCHRHSLGHCSSHLFVWTRRGRQQKQ